MSLVGTVASHRSKRSVSHFVPEQGTRGSKEWKTLHKEDFFLTTRHHQDHQTEEDEISGTHTHRVTTVNIFRQNACRE